MQAPTQMGTSVTLKQRYTCIITKLSTEKYLSDFVRHSVCVCRLMAKMCLETGNILIILSASHTESKDDYVHGPWNSTCLLYSLRISCNLAYCFFTSNNEWYDTN